MYLSLKKQLIPAFIFLTPTVSLFLILEVHHQMLILLRHLPWRPSEWGRRWAVGSRGNPRLCWLYGRWIIWSWLRGVCLSRRGPPGLFLHPRHFRSLKIVGSSPCLLARLRGVCGRVCPRICRTRLTLWGIQKERCVGLSQRLWGPLYSWQGPSRWEQVKMQEQRMWWHASSWPNVFCPFRTSIL